MGLFKSELVHNIHTTIFYYQPGRLVLRLLYVTVFVCVCVCVCVCARPQLSSVLTYVIALLIATSTVEATGSLQAQAKLCQARLVLCCLDTEKVVGNDHNFVLAGAAKCVKHFTATFRLCFM